MADITLFDIEDRERTLKPEPEMGELEFKAAKNRKKTGDESKIPSTGLFDWYTNAKTDEFINKKSNVVSMLGDSMIDLSPLALIAIGSLARGTDTYKAAKLRHDANKTDFKKVDANWASWNKGTVANPDSMFHRSIYDNWGKEAIENISKFQEKELNSLAKKYKMKPEEIKSYVYSIGTQGQKNVKDVPISLRADIEDYFTKLNDYAEKVNPLTEDVVNKNIRLIKDENGNIKSVDVPKGDVHKLRAPDTLKGIGIGAGVGGAINAVENLASKADKGGITPASFSLSEILTDTRIPLNKRKMLYEINERYDNLIKNGTPEQQKEAKRIMANINVKSKWGISEALLDLMFAEEM